MTEKKLYALTEAAMDMGTAWESGHSWGWDDARTKAWAEHGVDIIGPRTTWRLLAANPYEQEEA